MAETSSANLVIRELCEGDQAALDVAVVKFAESDPWFDFVFDYSPETDFAGYIEMLRQHRRGEALSPGRVAHTMLVAIEADPPAASPHPGVIVGRVSIRHELNDVLEQFGGHIGFGVVPTHRRRGIGHKLLAAGLQTLRELGVDRALVTCDDQNQGSIRIIEAAGGILEDKRPGREGGGLTRRYWIEV